MISLGDESTGSNRINLGGGSINSLGTSIGPVIIVSLALFGTAAAVDDKMIQALKPFQRSSFLYSAVGCLFLGVAALFGFSKRVPDGKTMVTTPTSNEGLIDSPLKAVIVEKAESAKKAVVTLLIITGLSNSLFCTGF